MPSQGSVDPQRPTPISRYGPVLFIELAIELGDRLRHFLAAAALEALRIDHDDIVKILDAAVAQNLAAAADQLLGSHIVESQILACRAPASAAGSAGSRTPPDLAGLLRQAHGKFDLHGIAQRILAGPHQIIQNLPPAETCRA